MKSSIIKSRLLLVIMAVFVSFGFFAVNVFAITPNSITITSPATKLTYTVGETLDISGLVVTGTYTNGDGDDYPQVETVTTGDISGFDSSVPVVGQTLTITIGGQTTTYNINVVAVPTPNSITITSPATKLTYTVGETLDISGLVVTGTYTNGDGDDYPQVETVTTGDISGFDSSVATTTQTLTITIKGKTTTYIIDVVAPIVYTLTYSAGENGTLTGSTTQSVNENTDGTTVTAVANSGFIFVDWSDASTTNPRTDSNVQGNITVTANFIENTVSGGGGSSSGSRSGGSRIVNTNSNVTTPTNEGQVLGAATYAFNSDLKLGMSGNDVKELQERLRAEGFFTFEISTGYFGEITLAAVKAYQTAHPEIGFVTGFVGPLTRAILNK